MYPWGPGMMGDYGYSAWWGIVMLLFWVALIAGAVVLVIWLVRQGQRGTPPAGGGDRALAILRERFARGEIDAEQYEQMRRALE